MDQKRKEGGLLIGLVLLFMMLLPSVVLASGEHGLTASVDGYQVNLFFIDAPKVGSVPVRIKITDVNGLPIDTAYIEVSGMQGMKDMDMSMAGDDMSSMATVPTQVLYKEQDDNTGNYYGVIPFSTEGDWILSTHFSANGQVLSANIPVDVDRNATALLVLLGFLGLNALIIWWASGTKQTPVSV